jgi:K+-sensing histidine kinase KdpD
LQPCVYKSESGEVAVCAVKEGVRNNNVLLHFTVTDSGVGIAPDKQAGIFQAFNENGSDELWWQSSNLVSVILRTVGRPFLFAP